MDAVFIANRGEIACRIIRACKAQGRPVIVACSAADKDALHTRLADDSVLIGDAHPRDSYLSIDNILAAAKKAEARAIHPGYGFLAESADFAEAVENAGLIWVGPSAPTIRAMGNKAQARAIAEAAGVPVLPGSGRVDAGDKAALLHAATDIGYPLLVKAAAGGGGIGMRIVESAEELPAAAESTSALAANAFGNAEIFLEKHVRRARHVEAQVFGDGQGAAIHFGERECSIQRRFQKIIEESPAPTLSPSIRLALCAAATRLAQVQNYAGAGTVEFIYDEAEGNFYFLEMNTRIQVEHGVTEQRYDVDLVGMQLRLALEHEMPPAPPPSPLYDAAIECRLCAEDATKQFLPAPGVLETLQFPNESEFLRIDSGYQQGDKVTPYYDSLLGKIISRGKTRAAAIETMREALSVLRVDGLKTNREFLLRCITHPAYAAADTTTDFIARHSQALFSP